MAKETVTGKNFVIMVLLLAVLMVSGCTASVSVIKVTIYKEPTCGCCVNYIGYLQDQGYRVETIEIQDMSSIKNKYGIPRSMESCHTMVIGDYFIEGHVPIEAVEKLLSENPDIDGIALPAMHAVSPGMPGTKAGSFVIYALQDSTAGNFMVI